MLPKKIQERGLRNRKLSEQGFLPFAMGKELLSDLFQCEKYQKNL